MAFLMAMASKTNVHGPATYMMKSGFLWPGFPCMGAWSSYGLGNLTDELPTLVVLPNASAPALRPTFAQRLADSDLSSDPEWMRMR